jgi:hypothetical protein
MRQGKKINFTIVTGHDLFYRELMSETEVLYETSTGVSYFQLINELCFISLNRRRVITLSHTDKEMK